MISLFRYQPWNKMVSDAPVRCEFLKLSRLENRTKELLDKVTQGRIFLEGMVQNWTAFCKVFNGNYSSEFAQKRKIEEFLQLCQGQMTVDQYEAKFVRLSKLLRGW